MGDLGEGSAKGDATQRRAHRLSVSAARSISNVDSGCVLNGGQTATCWLKRTKMLLRSGLLWRLGVLGVLWAALMLCQLRGSAARVIYFNALSSNESLAARNDSLDAVGRGMLFESRRMGCRRGYMYDHHNRCRRIV
ncbi:uncharacterized protein Dmoj_GI14619 [Drosophila mojavensis]|uniref:Uncharacterized protein n=2 Tax=Drosophila mojavensis TaxID=7230 RepID=B4L2R8_DROMO|nr:uncharacterized protein Dmoj_GI14619 [Drosophila mojavensis]